MKNKLYETCMVQIKNKFELSKILTGEHKEEITTLIASQKGYAHELKTDSFIFVFMPAGSKEGDEPKQIEIPLDAIQAPVSVSFLCTYRFKDPRKGQNKNAEETRSFAIQGSMLSAILPGKQELLDNFVNGDVKILDFSENDTTGELKEALKFIFNQYNNPKGNFEDLKLHYVIKVYNNY